MFGLVTGKVVHFILLILSILTIYYYIRKSVGGDVPTLRRLPAVDAIEEVLGRAVEMGKTVVFTHGTGKLETSGSAGSLAAIATLPYVARRTVELGLELFLPTGSHTAYNVLGEVMREAALLEGTPSAYNPDTVRYLSEVSRAYSAGVMSTLMTENVGGAIFLGSYHHAGLMVVETANRVGAMSVGGTDSFSQLCWFVAGCDYSLLGEEIYALGAYVSNDPISVGAIAGQDIIKMAVIVITLVGLILTQVGIDVASWFSL
jgi:hypothetical protein